MSVKPNFRRWAANISNRAQFGEGVSFNLPGDLADALYDAYRLGQVDSRAASETQPHDFSRAEVRLERESVE